MLPAIDQQLIDQVVLEHVRAWPEWVQEMQHAGGQAYAVLTICHAAAALATGRQVSKLAAASVGRSSHPQGSALIDWAEQWWYGGSDSAVGRFEEVRPFVDERALVERWSAGRRGHRRLPVGAGSVPPAAAAACAWTGFGALPASRSRSPTAVRVQTPASSQDWRAESVPENIGEK